MAITIRLTEEQEKDIGNLKFSVGEKSTSKALLKAAVLVPKLKDELWDSKEKIEKLENELRNIKYLISEKNSIAQRLIDMVEL